VNELKLTTGKISRAIERSKLGFEGSKYDPHYLKTKHFSFVVEFFPPPTTNACLLFWHTPSPVQDSTIPLDSSDRKREKSFTFDTGSSLQL
jgi:hypothetical protein